MKNVNKNSPNIEKLDKCETSIIEDMPPPQKITTTRYNLWEVKCLDCGHHFISKDPEEILGKEPEGANGTDGWRAYSWMKLQRCWAHLLREIDAFIDVSENGKRLSEDIHSCFKKLEIKTHILKMAELGSKIEKEE